MSESNDPSPMVTVLKKEDDDDPLAWAASESFAMESDSVLAAGTAAAGGQSENEDEINETDDDIGQMFDEPSSPIAADEPSDAAERTAADEEEEPVPSTSSAPEKLPAPPPKKVNKIKCFVAGCLHRHRAAVNASFHKWPKNDPQTKSAWISACGRQDVLINEHQGICGLHFADDAYISSDLWRKEMNFAPKKRQLKEGAIPTLNLMSKVEDYVIRYMKRVTMKTPSGEEIKTNKIRVEVGPLYEHLMKTIKDPQLINITANVVVARPVLAKRTKGPKDLTKSEYICRIKNCPFQDEKAFMFCFPESDYQREVWSKLCDLKRSHDNTDRNCWVPRVCSYHFKNEDFELTPTGFRDLKENARPELHLGEEPPLLTVRQEKIKEVKVCLKRLADSDLADAVPSSPKKTAKSNNSEDEMLKILERKELINQLLKESSEQQQHQPKRRPARAAHSRHPGWNEVFEDVESAYEAVGAFTAQTSSTTPGVSSGLRSKSPFPTRNFAAQVDFPDGCNLLVYQCLKQLRSALAAKDEEIKHLRVLVHHLSSELKERKSTMVLATPFVIDEDFQEETLPSLEKYWFCDQTTPKTDGAAGASMAEALAEAQDSEDVYHKSLRPNKNDGRGRPKKDTFMTMISENKGSIRTMCCVPGCPSPVTVAYHKFPSLHSPFYNIWLEKCIGANDGNVKDMSNATVCGQHFDDDCFDIEVTMNEENTETRTRTILKDDAIPSLQLNEFANL